MARKSRRSRQRAKKRSTRRPRQAAPEPAAPKADELRWRVLPCARDWRLTAAAVALLLLVLSVVHLTFGHLGWVALSALLLLGSLASFFLPTTYTVTDEGVVVRGPFGATRRDWDDLRSYRVDAHGVLLSPFSRPSRLEGFRGVYLRFGANREPIMAMVSRKTTPVRLDHASPQNE